MSKLTFRPVAPLIDNLNAMVERREALFVDGPVVIAIVTGFAQAYVVANFIPPGHDNLLPDWIGTGNTNLGYVVALFNMTHDHDGMHTRFTGLAQAHNHAWHLYLNTTYSHEDIVVRRHVRRATTNAEVKARLFSIIDDNYFDHGVHPTTLTDDEWYDETMHRLDDNLVGARFRDPVTTISLLPQWVRDETQVQIDALFDARFGADYDADAVVLPAETGNVPNVADDGEFPAWDDPDHGLEARWSKSYEHHHRIAA